MQHPYAKALKCRKCPMLFSKLLELKAHFRCAHVEKKKNHVCDICNKAFTNKSALNVHYRLHTGEMPYACSLCDRKFNQLGNLQNHEATHFKSAPKRFIKSSKKQLKKCGFCLKVSPLISIGSV